MREGYARVDKRTYNNAAGKIRKVRCQCTGDGAIKTSKEFQKDQLEGKSWDRADYFNYKEVEEMCPKCGFFRWYKI